jgi:hypothetical protein
MGAGIFRRGDSTLCYVHLSLELAGLGDSEAHSENGLKDNEQEPDRLGGQDLLALAAQTFRPCLHSTLQQTADRLGEATEHWVSQLRPYHL